MLFTQFLDIFEYDSTNTILWNKWNGSIYLIPSHELLELTHDIQNDIYESKHIEALKDLDILLDEEIVPQLFHPQTGVLIFIEITNRCNLTRFLIGIALGA